MTGRNWTRVSPDRDRGREMGEIDTDDTVRDAILQQLQKKP
jgi:hypothetical protein